MKITFCENFQDFKAKVESVFGPIQNLRRNDPDTFCHQVIAHGFMEFRLATLTEGSLQEIRACFEKWYAENQLPPELMEQGWREYLED